MTTMQVEKKLTDAVVYEYWETKAATAGDDPLVTIRDHHYRELEIEAIQRHLSRDDRVLDIGCGNGHATLQYAPLVRHVTGVDYSPSMIEAAKRLIGSESREVQSRTTFAVADARDLPYEDASFSCVVMERCLINIPDRTQQITAAAEAARVLTKGGLLLLAEVTLQGHEKVNHYRTMFGLDKLKVHWHNTYLDEPTFLKAACKHFTLIDTVRFGMYGFLSKVLHPMFSDPKEPSFDGRINKVAAQIARKIPDFDGCTHQVMFVLKKKK